jgi:hypothetical protein
MFVTMDCERRESLTLHDKELVTAQKACHDKDRLTSHVTAKLFAWAALACNTIWANSSSVTASPVLVFTLD